MYDNLLKISRKQNNAIIFFSAFLALICIYLLFSTQLIRLYYTVKGDNNFNPTYEQIYETDIKSDYKEFSTSYLVGCYGVYDMSLSNFPSREYSALYFPPDSDTPLLMAVEVPWYKYSQAERVCEAAVYAQNNDNTADTAEAYTARGSVRLMTDEELDLFEQAYGDWNVEWLPYIICDNKMSYIKYDGTASEKTPILYLCGAMFGLLAFVPLFSGIKSNRLIGDISRQKYEFEEQYGEGSFDAACNECEFAHNIADSIYISNNWLAFAKYKPVILPLRDIVWIYKETTRYNFIKVSTEVVIKTIDKQSYSIKVKDKGEIDQLKDWIPTEYNIVFGYDDKLAYMYRQNPEQLRELGKSLNNRE